LKILLVKLSSLGDVVHTLPAWADIRRALPQAQVAWVVEPAFAPLLRAAGVGHVVEAPLRRWRGQWFSTASRAERLTLRTALQADAWDAVIDLQGLVKSAWVMGQARRSPSGFTCGLGNRTDGSSWEWPVRWMQQRSIVLPAHLHAVARSRLLVAKALGLADPSLVGSAAGPAMCLPGPPGVGAKPGDSALSRTVVLVHGTSRADKLWPEASWLALGQALLGQGWRLALPSAGQVERERAQRLAQALGPDAVAWPELSLDDLAKRMAQCAGCVGVDSGVSHIAVALDLPHVQIYNLPTAWRTGPVAGVFGSHRQVSVQAPEPGHQATPPSVDQVWSAWLGVSPGQPGG
jgi:heptosyltransferase-1